MGFGLALAGASILGGLGGLLGRKKVSFKPIQPKPGPVDPRIVSGRLAFLDTINELARQQTPIEYVRFLDYLGQKAQTVAQQTQAQKALTPFGTIDLYALRKVNIANKLLPEMERLKFLTQMYNTYNTSVVNPLMQMESLRYHLPTQIYPIVQTNPLGDFLQGAIGGGLGFINAMTNLGGTR